MVKPGALLAHRYRLDVLVAAGRIGDVWRAFDLLLDRYVAIKMFDRRLDHAGFADRFRREARTMAALRHPGIADVYNYLDATADHPACLIMQYVEGQPLDRRLAAGPLAPQ